MPTAPDPVLATGLPAAPAAPVNTAGGGSVAAPAAPANSAGSGSVAAPAAPTNTAGGGGVALPYTTAPCLPAWAGPNFLTTGFAGTNNNLRFEQVTAGAAPPTIQFTMDNVSVNEVTVTGGAILIHLRRNFGEFYLNAVEIKQLIETSDPAMALVRVGYPVGENGSGVICSPANTDISFGPTALSGALPVAPSAPTNAAGSGSIAAPAGPAAIQAGGLPAAPTAPAAVQA
jgi:hypothetical protein